MNSREIPDYNQPDLAIANRIRYRSHDHRVFHPNFYGAIEQEIKEGEHVRALDIGSGTGENSRIMKQLGAFVVAVEPSLTMRVLGSDYYEDVTVIDDTLPYLAKVEQLKGGSFDFVLISNTLQYIPPKEVFHALNCLAPLVKNDTWIRITYPNPPSKEHQFSLPPIYVEDMIYQVNKLGDTFLKIVNKNSSPSSDGRKSLGGEPLYFVEFDLRVVL
jgi:SAM-dependent methyltransferase